MNATAVAVLRELPDIRLAYGISDEFRFVKQSFDTLTSADIVTLVSYSIAPASSLNDVRGRLI